MAVMSRLGVGRNGDQITVEEVNITPEIAAKFLAMNTRNRTPTPMHVKYLEEVFRRGEMALNGQTIKFSKSGVLLDGQHRLMACVNTGIPFPCIVVTGLPDDVLDTIDTGSRPRHVSDVLSMRGEVSSKQLAAAVRLLVTYRATWGEIYSGGARMGVVTPRECEELLARHPRVRDSVRLLGQRANFVWRVGNAMALHYLFSLSSEKVAEQFADVLLNGSGDTSRPFNMFRESLLKAKARKGRLDLRLESARAVKAFNHELAGTRPRLLVWSSSESFPLIQGLDPEAL